MPEEKIIYDLLYDTVKTFELTVEKSLPKCPVEVTLSQKCENLLCYELVKIEKTDELKFKVSVSSAENRHISD